MKFKKYGLISVAVVAFFLVSASSCGSSSTQSDAKNKDQATSAKILANFERSQPAPVRPWSQLRQNLIELEIAQSDTTQTTSFFFNQGVTDPVQTCPSIGFPIASTSEITNPEQTITGPNHSGLTIPQIDPNGIYAGNSTGTYVICIDANGKAYADYWEGFVQTVTGPAQWNETKHTVDLVGPPSFNFSTKKGG